MYWTFRHKKYIDAAELIKLATNRVFLGNHFGDVVKAYVAACPPADVRENVRGEWVLQDEQCQEDVDNGNYRYTCTNCGRSDLHAVTTIVPFCWYCGADMGGVIE